MKYNDLVRMVNNLLDKDIELSTRYGGLILNYSRN